MRARLVVASLVVVAGIGVFAGTLLATPPSKVTPTEYGVGAFEPFATTGKVGAWKAAMKITALRPLRPFEQDRAGRIVRVAQSSRAELRDRQVGNSNRLPRRRPDMPAAQDSGGERIRRQGFPGPRRGTKRGQGGPS